MPIGIVALQMLQPGSNLDIVSTFLRRPCGAVTYAILFGVGALLAVRSQKVIWAFLLLPVLGLAIWPVFRGTAEELPVPEGAIVAFGRVYHETEHGCPAGWEPTEHLAGRFPLGAGQGEGLTLRQLGDDAEGAETHVLAMPEMPSHSHDFTTFARDFRRGSGGIGVLQGRTTGTTQPAGGNSDGETQPHNNMPPFHVVQFCTFTGAPALAADSSVEVNP
ncbi:hypothetical protein [Paracoccus sp. (in: a-proteobacteria)]|uniref:phage tail protein n=1 Tax=Paracoccus sp. TaxID=267 RepID=UPI002AFEB961|nr:hypothetical protein [Paracoccus sp. (in: a-proteobacteria)]